MMKKILASAVLIGFSLTSSAQIFNFGIKGGINSLKISSNNNGNSFVVPELGQSEGGTGYHIGAFAQLTGKRFYFQPEFLLSSRKSFNQLSFVYSDISHNRFSQSFDIKAGQIPLLLGIKLFNFKLASITAFTGPAMSLILGSSKICVKDEANQTNNFPHLNNIVWDWQAGAGIDMGKLVLDIRCEWGLTNITDLGLVQNSFLVQHSFNNKGNTCTFSVGYKFL